MTGDYATRVAQKTTLYDLLHLKKMNPDKEVIGLNLLIARAKVAMEAEDVAHIEKYVGTL